MRTRLTSQDLQCSPLPSCAVLESHVTLLDTCFLGSKRKGVDKIVSGGSSLVKNSEG